MLYETIRSINGIEENNHENILKLLPKKKDYKILNNYKGKNIIVLSHPCFSDTNGIIRGEFDGGVFKEIEFYKSRKELNAHIWFKEGGHAKGLDYIYDIMFADSIKENSSEEELKIFNFRASAAYESENSNIIHFDPFLAYKQLRDENRIISPVQQLRSIEPIKKGKIFYHHVTDHS